MSKVAYLIAAISRYTTVPDNDTRVFSIAIVNNDSEIATAAAMGATTTRISLGGHWVAISLVAREFPGEWLVRIVPTQSPVVG